MTIGKITVLHIVMSTLLKDGNNKDEN